MQKDEQESIRVFCCSVSEDKKLVQMFDKHLSSLRHSSLINEWSDHEIKAEECWTDMSPIQAYLNCADVCILLLVSPEFIASRFFYSLVSSLEELKRKNTVIIPIILRPTLWELTPLGTLQALPINGKPVTEWRNRDSAFVDVVMGVWTAVCYLNLRNHSPERPLLDHKKAPSPESPPLDHKEAPSIEYRIAYCQRPPLFPREDPETRRGRILISQWETIFSKLFEEYINQENLTSTYGKKYRFTRWLSDFIWKNDRSERKMHKASYLFEKAIFQMRVKNTRTSG